MNYKYIVLHGQRGAEQFRKLAPAKKFIKKMKERKIKTFMLVRK